MLLFNSILLSVLLLCMLYLSLTSGFQKLLFLPIDSRQQNPELSFRPSVDSNGNRLSFPIAHFAVVGPRNFIKRLVIVFSPLSDHNRVASFPLPAYFRFLENSIPLRKNFFFFNWCQIELRKENRNHAIMNIHEAL